MIMKRFPAEMIWISEYRKNRIYIFENRKLKKYWKNYGVFKFDTGLYRCKMFQPSICVGLFAKTMTEIFLSHCGRRLRGGKNAGLSARLRILVCQLWHSFTQEEMYSTSFCKEFFNALLVMWPPLQNFLNNLLKKTYSFSMTNCGVSGMAKSRFFTSVNDDVFLLKSSVRKSLSLESSQGLVKGRLLTRQTN
jgi:hypothetical protein